MRLILTLIISSALLGCGPRSAPKQDPSSCVPGDSKACACPLEVPGVQTCAADGTYNRCQCAGDSDVGDLPDLSLPDMGQPDIGDCVPETDAQLCTAAALECGATSATDKCGQARTPNCGSCTGNEECVQNVCTCGPETDAQLCSSVGAECGGISEVDRCGANRSTNCGGCGAGEVCMNNICERVTQPCAVDNTFFGQIGGFGLHEGGVPTTAALSGDSGLSQIAAAMPLTAGTFASVSINVTSATVIATTFDSRANETFWLQDGVTVGHVRLAFATIFENVRVGDKVSFRATELQNFEGHPQISGLDTFTILSSDNAVPYVDRTGGTITVSDYGKIVRVGGVLGAPTACGGVSNCFPMSHGARTTTYRTASTFSTTGDCVTFIGPVSSFPGPLEIGAEAQVDAINFDWTQTIF